MPFIGDGVDPEIGSDTEIQLTSSDQTSPFFTEGDGRTPASSFAGNVGFDSLTLTDVTVTDPVTGLPVTTASGLSLTQVWVTADAADLVSRDPDRSLVENTWCDGVNGAVVSGPGTVCPTTPFEVTAVYGEVMGGTGLEPDQTLDMNLNLVNELTECGDIWTNTFGLRSDEIGLPIRSNDVSVMVRCPMSIGSYVWEDTDVDGVQDLTEPAIAGAVVELLVEDTDPDSATFGMFIPAVDVQGDPIAAVTTGLDGLYEFTNLPSGDYKVVVTPPSTLVNYGPTPIQTTADDDDTENDSNIAGAGAAAGSFESGVFSLVADMEPIEADAFPGDDQEGVSGGLEDINGNQTIDFGFVRPVSIGSTLFLDNDADGLQDLTEPGIAGATVNLLNADGTPALDLNGLPLSVVTGLADGAYFFDNLAPGMYQVQVVMPDASFVATPTQVVADNGVENDSNIDVANSTPATNTYVSPIIDLQPGTEAIETNTLDDNDALDNAATAIANDNSGDMTVDFGFVQPVSIGSVVWLDANNDGDQDAGEAGIAGAVVTLLNADGTAALDINGNPQMVTTDATGAYFFDDLAPGDYIVQVVTPDDTFSPTANQNDADDDVENDSNIDVANSTPADNTYQSGVITLQSGTEAVETGTDVNDDSADAGADNSGNMTVDFGFITPVSIGSVIWEDVNGDGLQDAAEPLIAEGLVTLLDADGNPAVDIDGNPVAPIDLAVTGGTYLFDNLAPGSYQVQVSDLPAEFGPTPVQNTADDDDTANDSNIAVDDGAGTYTSGTFELTSGGEPTDADEDSGLAGSGDAADDATDANGNMTVDFGFVTPLSVGSFVWEDLNGDGIQDANEPPISGAVVTLLLADGTPALDADGLPVAAQTTGADGLYYFDNLPEGDYIVQVTPANGLTPSPVQSAADDDVAGDSNIAGESATTAGAFVSPPFNLAYGEEPQEADTSRGDAQDGVAGSGADLNGNMTIDFGFVPPASIGDYIWLDLNMDGVQDANEEGIANVVVTLTPPAGVDLGNGPGVAITTTTDTEGGYLFPDLPPFTSADPSEGYVVSVDPADPALAPFDQTYDEGVLPGSLGTLDNSSEPIQLDPNEFHETADFGYAPAAGTIGDTIWIDTNGDGIQDPEELGVPGVTVTLTDGFGNETTAVTDANGNYLFTDLPLGVTYQVVVSDGPGTPLEEYTHHANGDPDVRDGITTDPDSTTFVTLTDDMPVNLDADFGYLPPDSQNNSIGDTIWLDEDGDGNGPVGAGDGSDTTEAGIAGVTVALIDNVTGAIVATTTTDANGQYLFTGVPDGEYVVEVTDLNNVLAGFDQTVDSDDAANPGAFAALTPNLSEVIDLDSAGASATPVEDLDQDFGYMDPSDTGGTIGDTIYFDRDGDATQGADEDGFEGVVVELFDENGVLIASTTTDANGKYLFTGLDVSDTGVEYTVVVDTSTLPNGPDSWENTADADGLFDSTSVTTLTTAVPDDLDQDFGYNLNGVNSLSGTVWSDTDGDGVLVNEGSFAGVTVEIRDQDGNVIAKVVTDADGNYEVNNLPDGLYTVVVTDENGVLSGVDHTNTPNGADDKTDSTSKNDTGYLVDLDSAGLIDEPVVDTTGDFGYMPVITTPITLGSFSATSVTGGVQIDWTTQTEVSNLGFNLYASIDGEWVQINDAAIIGQGDSIAVQSYSVTLAVSASVFAISDIDSAGNETIHGPFNLDQSYGDVGERQMIDWNAEKDELETQEAIREQERLEQQRQRIEERRLRRSTQPTGMNDVSPSVNEEYAMQVKSSNWLSKVAASVIAVLIPSAHAVDLNAEDIINLNTTVAGIHEVSYEDLADFGLDGIPVNEFALMNQGEPVQIQVIGSDADASVFGAGASVRFIADQVDTLYSDTNVYTLRLDTEAAQVRMAQESLAIPSGASATAYLAKATYAPQVAYSYASPDETDPWYAKRMIAIGEAVSETVQLTLITLRLVVTVARLRRS